MELEKQVTTLGRHPTADDRQEDEDIGHDSLNGSSGSYNFVPDSPADDEEASQMDDLMFALRTGTSYPQGDLQPLVELDSRRKPTGSEQLQLRRISIADTHV